MPVAGETNGKREREENEETKDNILEFAVAAVEPTVSENPVPGFARKGRTGRQFRINADTGQSQFNSVFFYAYVCVCVCVRIEQKINFL